MALLMTPTAGCTWMREHWFSHPPRPAPALADSSPTVRRPTTAPAIHPASRSATRPIAPLVYLSLIHIWAAVASGTLGRLINVESRLGQWSSCVGPAAREWRPGWRNEASFGGGGLFDWGSHFVDQLWRLLWPRRPVRVFAQLRGNVWSRDCDDFARLLIDFDGGTAGLVEINTTTTRPLPRWHLDGTAGSADSPHSPAFDLSTWAQLDFTPAPADGPAGGSGEAQRLAPTESAEAGLTEVQIWEQFAAAVRGQGPPAVTAASVLPTMALLDAARESSRTGMAVDVAGAVDWVY